MSPQSTRWQSIGYSLLLSLCLFVLPPSPLWGASCTILWDYPDPPPDLSHFTIYTAPTPGGPYTRLITAPKEARKVQIPTCPERHFATATATDTENLESLHSNEIQIPNLPPSAPGNLSVDGELILRFRTTTP